jgi:galactose-1-phosphate uridylyltransferase
MKGKKVAEGKWIDRGCLTKKRYGTKEKAERAVSKAKRDYDETKKLYYCPLCSGYHLWTPDKD